MILLYRRNRAKANIRSFYLIFFLTGDAMEYIRSAHSVYLLTYHIVFVTKYRKPVINDEISEFLKNHISYLCTRFDAELLTAETDRDHIHMLISMPPKVAPADLILKKYIYGDAPLWQPSYFVATTGTTVMEKVREYIDFQQTEEHRRKYEKTGKYSKKRHR